VYGQESNPTTWKLAKMNLAIRGITSDLGKENADSFHKDLHPDLKADFILANPPFNMSDWGGERLREDKRWKYGAPPTGNANYAWVQHFIHHLAPNGMAGFVLANGSMSSNTSGEGGIRKAIIEADLVDCMVALPGQLFFSTQIPVCLWFLTRDKAPTPTLPHLKDTNRGGRDRRGETLFIDARKMGTLVDRVHRDLTDEDIAKIADTYHAWSGKGEAGGRGESLTRPYEDIAGFCKSVPLKEIQEQGFVLTPGRYVGATLLQEDMEPFEQKMRRLTKELEAQFEESGKLEKVIRKSLERFDYDLG
jgi:type I restriction enzyme M protein